MVRKLDDGARDSVAHGFGAMASKGGTVLRPCTFAMAWHGRQMQQHRETCRSFDQRTNGRTVQSDDQVTFPMSRNSAVIGFGRAFADHDFR